MPSPVSRHRSPGLIVRIASAAALALPLFPSDRAEALPAVGYEVELVSQPGASNTSVRGVDSTGRVLGYWSVFNQPFPRPIGTPPDDEGFFLWENGTSTPLTVPGLTGVNIHRMNAGGAMWGSSDQGSFVYRNDAVQIVESTATDVTLIQGVDGAGRVYGILGNIPPGVDPDGPLVPVDPVSMFMWENDVFSELTLLLSDATLHGVRQDGVLWGSNTEMAFIQDGSSLTTVDHPDFDYTGLRMLSADGDAFGFGLTTSEQTFDSIDFFWNEAGGFADWPDDQDLPGTSLRPHSMNENEVFWGVAGLPNTAFVATPIPEPSTALLVALGLSLLGRRSRS